MRVEDSSHRSPQPCGRYRFHAVLLRRTHMATCAFVSFRLGLTDGVSVVATQWMRAFESIGFEVLTVAGEGPVDHEVPGLAIDADVGPKPEEMAAVLDGVDLVVVENVLTIPMNLSASAALAGALQGRPALLHHHDPPWQRARYRHITELPADDPAWRHVTINKLTAAEMGERGIAASVVYNGFDTDPPDGDRRGMRAALDVDDDELLVVQPARAIERKDVARGIQTAEEIGATFWITGPAEEGFQPTLDALVTAARCRVIHRRAHDVNDLYAAADLVVFPSTWEGFGNPPIEASIRCRPVAVGRYPVAEELRALGFRWMDARDSIAIAEATRAPDPVSLAHNRELADRHFSLARMQERVHGVLADAGWLP